MKTVVESISKIHKVIESCKTSDQIVSALKMIDAFEQNFYIDPHTLEELRELAYRKKVVVTIDGKTGENEILPDDEMKIWAK